MGLSDSKPAPMAGGPQRTDSRQGHPVSGHANNCRDNSDVLVDGEEFLNDVIEETHTVEKERGEKLKGLMNRVETFMRELPQQDTDGLSQQLAFRANRLRENLHMRLLTPVEYQDETGFDRHGRDEFCSDAINKTPLLNQDQIWFVDLQRTGSGQRHSVSVHANNHRDHSDALVNGEEVLNDIIEETKKVEKESDEKVKRLLNLVETFMRQLPQQSTDGSSQQLKFRANRLREKLHMKLLKPVEYQDEAGFDSHSRDKFCSDDSNKTSLVNKDDSGIDSQSRDEFCSDDSNKTSLVNKDDSGVDSHSRDEFCSDDSSKTSLVNKDESGVDSHSRDEFCSDDSSKTSLVNKDESGVDRHKLPKGEMRYERGSGEKASMGNTNMTPASCAHVNVKSGQAHEHSNQLLESSKQMEIIGSNEVELLLIGKTGNGKSATGNSILRRTAFESDACTSAVTSTVDYEFSEFSGRIIKVVDCPGVGDNRLNTEGAVRLVMDKMQYAISANPRGYHAFLLVVRFGGRFTAEDRDTIHFLKKIFGQDFVKQFCILVLTCGDNFEHESEKKSVSFQQWCNQQDGDFKTLVMECDNRVVLFDNRTKDPAKQNKQIENLIKVVDNLSSRGKRYNDENFARALKAREQIIVESQKTIIEEETMKETSLIILTLKGLATEEDLRSKVESLGKLQARVEFLLESLACKDQGTGALHDLRSNVESIHRNVNDEKQWCCRMIDDMENVRQREEEIRRKQEQHSQIEKQQERQNAEMEEKSRQEREAIEMEKKEMEEERKQKLEIQRQQEDEIKIKKAEMEEKSRQEKKEIEMEKKELEEERKQKLEIQRNQEDEIKIKKAEMEEKSRQEREAIEMEKKELEEERKQILEIQRKQEDEIKIKKAEMEEKSRQEREAIEMEKKELEEERKQKLEIQRKQEDEIKIKKAEMEETSKQEKEAIEMEKKELEEERKQKQEIQRKQENEIKIKNAEMEEKSRQEREAIEMEKKELEEERKQNLEIQRKQVDEIKIKKAEMEEKSRQEREAIEMEKKELEEECKQKLEIQRKQEDEIKIKKAEMEEKSRQEREAIEMEKKELENKLKQKQDDFRKKCEELEKIYKTVKQENDEGILDRIIAAVKWPLKIILEVWDAMKGLLES